VTGKQDLIVLLDEGTPVLAGAPFLTSGHQVINHHEVCEAGATDQVVAAQAILNMAILIAVDLDMKRLTRRFGGPRDGGRYDSLHLMFVSCDATLAAKRIEHSMSFIEHEWTFACKKKARRFWIDIASHRLTSYR
jgi:hypothetical protein